MQFKETDDIFRLYMREWVTVHTITMSAPSLYPVMVAAQQWVAENLTGRVRPEEINLVANTDTPAMDNVEQVPLLFWVHVQIFKENLQGEFKYAANAAAFAEAQGFEEYTVVARNSKDDHDIRSYGVKKL